LLIPAPELLPVALKFAVRLLPCFSKKAKLAHQMIRDGSGFVPAWQLDNRASECEEFSDGRALAGACDIRVTGAEFHLEEHLSAQSKEL